MKLSEITGSQAVEVIAELIDPLANIASDRENIGNIFNVKPNEGESKGEATIRMLKESVPILLKTHNADVRRILGIVNSEDPESLTVPQIVKGTFDLLGDDDFMALFMSAVPKEARQQPTKSSAKRGTTSKPE